MGKTYFLTGIGKEVDGGLAAVVGAFWQAWEVRLEPREPLPGLSFPTRDSFTQWAYGVYLAHWHQGRTPDLVVVTPQKSLGGWRHTWEGTAYDAYQIALVKEQVPPALRFVATHEVGHLLGLPDHWWPPQCVMGWYPWWMLPLAARTVCGNCRRILEKQVP